MSKARKSYSKIVVTGWPQVYSAPDRQILLSFEGENSNGTDTQGKVIINTWQFVDMVKKVGELLKVRIEHDQYELESLKKAVGQ